MAHWTMPLPGLMRSGKKQTGTIWTSESVTGTWRGAAYGGGTWIVTGTASARRSTNGGISWSTVTLPAGTWFKAAYGDGVWVAVGQSGAIRSVDDGLTWTAIPSVSGSWTSIYHNNGTWIAVSASVANWKITRSINGGVSFSQVNYNVTQSLVSIRYGGGVWIACASGSGNSLIRSVDDGLTWAAVASATDLNTNAVEYGNGIWSAIRTNGELLVSTDAGVTWPVKRIIPSQTWNSIVYRNGVWMTLGTQGNLGADRFVRSTDDWNSITTPSIPVISTDALYDLASSNDESIIAGNGRILRSVA